MMKTVKHTFSSIGDRGGDIASGTVDLAKRFGSGTAGLAKRIGPRRGLLGLAVIVAAVGGSVVLIRYLRSRRTELDATGDGAFSPTKPPYGSHARPGNGTGAPPIAGTH